ncbi:uncharacterized protein LOC118478330 [Aplysia californica]|uniref:Uncharacterized protein LOC118478330 n=1 Tax=Aplysia californica TaxID=6500 RepID=A0ABM1VZ14_APLCA|nr:uncharacterized protein LOC118478330 [Aplysia californica]
MFEFRISRLQDCQDNACRLQSRLGECHLRADTSKSKSFSFTTESDDVQTPLTSCSSRHSIIPESSVQRELDNSNNIGQLSSSCTSGRQVEAVPRRQRKTVMPKEKVRFHIGTEDMATPEDSVEQFHTGGVHSKPCNVLKNSTTCAEHHEKNTSQLRIHSNNELIINDIPTLNAMPNSRTDSNVSVVSTLKRRFFSIWRTTGERRRRRCQHLRDLRTIKTLMCMFAICYVCWTPAMTLKLLSNVLNIKTYSFETVSIAYLFAISNSVWNFLVYPLRKADLRRAIIATLPRCLRRRTKGSDRSDRVSQNNGAPSVEGKMCCNRTPLSGIAEGAQD